MERERESERERDCHSSAVDKCTDRKVGLFYDERMCKHETPNGDDHPENPNRIRVIWNKLKLAGVTERCVVLNVKEAEDEYIKLVHSKKHVELVKNISSPQFNSQRKRIASKLDSIYLNKGSSEAAYLAAGAVIEATERVAKRELDSAFAIVRPPGHHAEKDEAMGFCLFNNVAVAASSLLNKNPALGINKILIVDWDVHHGNGTQKMFWKDPRVLFFSVHRHEFGCFYPGNDDGFYNMIGEGPGAGYNINVPWENGRCGDADYLAVWDHILIPVTKEYNPDIILVSAGFDAAIRDPLGGCRITPYGYSVMLRKLTEFAQGKIVLALEGGYNLNSIANSALACVEVLLKDKHINCSCEAYPFASTWRVIQAVRKELSSYWPSLADALPDKIISQISPMPCADSSSSSEAEEDEIPVLSKNHDSLGEDIAEHFSKLKVEDPQDQIAAGINSWRLELSQVEVWYASYGSNMWRPRFLCYIEGGQTDGMKNPCIGSRDKNPPKETIWKIFPHRLLFGRQYTPTWGAGGVAFLHPMGNIQEKTYMCLHKITLEQFNDVLHQENRLGSHDTSSPLIDLEALQSISNKGSSLVKAFKGGWYDNVVFLGKEGDIPILTMTCSLEDIKKFKSRELPLCGPSEDYSNTLVQGLVEGKQMTEEEARAYIDEASSKRI